MKKNSKRKFMNAAIRRGLVGALALGFVLCETSVRATEGVLCCLPTTRESSPGRGVCVLAPTPRACVSQGGRTATSCWACFREAPMIQQPGAEDGDGDSVSDATDETAGFDLADAASGTEDAGDAVEDAGASDSSPADGQTESAWTLLIAALFLAGL